MRPHPGLAALLMILACGSTPAPQASVVLNEFSIHSTAETFSAGRIELMLRNTGSYGHTVVVTDAGGRVVAAQDLLSQSERSTLTLDLEPGEYQLSCRIIGQDGEGKIVDHYEEGMMAAIRVEAS